MGVKREFLKISSFCCQNVRSFVLLRFSFRNDWCRPTPTVLLHLCLIRARTSKSQPQPLSLRAPVSGHWESVHGVTQDLTIFLLSLLQGLRQQSSDPEELEVAAVCMQWRRKLVHHRRRETSHLDCDELGLRKTGTKPPPPLVALVQEAL